MHHCGIPVVVLIGLTLWVGDGSRGLFVVVVVVEAVVVVVDDDDVDSRN